jgi:hypothetical protein
MNLVRAYLTSREIIISVVNLGIGGQRRKEAVKVLLESAVSCVVVFGVSARLVQEIWLSNTQRG